MRRIAPYFGSYARRIRQCMLVICASGCNAANGPKDKPDGVFIFCQGPYYIGVCPRMPFFPNSALREKNNPRNIKHMPVVIFFACLP